MKKFQVSVTVQAHVRVFKTIDANTADEARRKFVNRIGKWESTPDRALPEVELTHSLFPNTDYSGDDIEIDDVTELLEELEKEAAEEDTYED